ncbi:MAG: hypothetical protein IT385_05075 [Deltaproteobacteria bacterium]|nr:hypothetical protein [Deltaproteobacteria bacterium]
MGTEREAATPESFGPRSRSGIRRPARTTSRWLIGRLIRIAREAGCGFVRSPSGGIVYFSLADLAGGESAALTLRPGARMRFQPAGHGVPKALAIAAV